MSKTFQFVDHLIEESVSCTDNAERLIACYDQTGDPDFLDLAEEFSALADQYSSEVENLLELIGLTQAVSGK